ncbi:MAG TPA: hypothetical protein VME18_04685 [Acidobacteriaceae bacterium]|nr:hypothetical protein [Acidobacteriaceae bacterium]
MKRGIPPAAAVWVVEHLVPRSRCDGLAGDLLEEMAAGRTSQWYWRQAAGAVAAGWLGVLKDQRPVLLLALLWASLGPAWIACFNALDGGVLASSPSWRMDSSWGEISTFSMWMILNLLFVWTPVLLCMIPGTWISRSFSRSRFPLAFLLSAFVYFAGYFVTYVLMIVYAFPGPSIPWQRFTPLAEAADIHLWALALRVPYLLAVLCALWVTRPARGTAGGSGALRLARPAAAAAASDWKAFSRQGLGGLMLAGLLSTLFLCVLLCRMPQFHGVLSVALLVKAVLYVVAAALAGAAGTAVYWNSSSSAFVSHAPVTLDRFAIDSAACWVWVPAAFLLGTNDSLLTPLVAGLGAAMLGLRLRAAIPDAATPETGAAELFERALRKPRREWHGLFTVLCVLLSVLALDRRLLLASALSLAVAGFAFAWKYKAPLADFSDLSQGNRQAVAKLLRITGPAVLVTLAVLVFGFSGIGYRLVGVVNSSVRAASELQPMQVRSETSGNSSYHSIILWPPEQKKRLIPPLTERNLLLTPRATHPLIIDFDGPYWYFQAPSRNPGLHAHQEIGTPVDYRIKASGGPLTMEARQKLGGEVRLADCSEISMTIANRNNRPGVISLALLLADSAAPGKRALYLGQQPVVSSEPGNFAVKASPVTETLRYAVPQRARLGRFNQIIVMFLREKGQSDSAPEIAIRQFALYAH